jgi:hypothetical protein
MNRLRTIRQAGLSRETRRVDDVEGHGLRFPVRTVTERLVRLCEDLEAQHVPAHGSWLSLAQIDMASLTSEWLQEESPAAGTAASGAGKEALPMGR